MFLIYSTNTTIINKLVLQTLEGAQQKIREGRINNTQGHPDGLQEGQHLQTNDEHTPRVPKPWRNATMEHVTCVPRNPTMFQSVSNWNDTGTMEQA